MALSATDNAIGNYLVERRQITLQQLDEAAGKATRWGVSLGDVLLAKGWIRAQDYYKSLANNLFLPFVNLIDEPPDQELLAGLDQNLLSESLIMPWRQEGERIILATARPGPETILLAQKIWGDRFDIVVTSKFDIIWSLQKIYRAVHSHRAVYELAEVDPDMSARQVLGTGQIIVIYGLISLLLLGAVIAPVATLIALNLLLTIFYLGNSLLRAALVWTGGLGQEDFARRLDIRAKALRDEELPTYTILVPMFREPETLPILAQALRSLDYPLAKLDIKLVLEENDSETIEAAKALGLEGIFEIIRVPESQPQTKPKACNYALQFARGELLVIYDAEDKPETDQLRKVVAAFRLSSDNTACIQCRLNYYNARENWLTRMFTLDYSLWFDLMLPGLQRMGIPIPLGGTSNHFKIDVLRELHAWDPFNVTEDADLGIRMTQKGYRVSVIDSTTFEEANCEAGNWIRQRSRWIKGYMQTFLVHTRRPLHLLKTIGLRGVTGFAFFIGGTALSGILNPIFWSIFAIWLTTETAGFDPFFPPIVLYFALFNLLIGNGLMIFLTLIAPFRRGWMDLIPYGTSVVGYWMLMSIAAYKALWQLVAKPFYWEKTRHGISRQTALEIEKARTAQMEGHLA
ncbi:glycosyltransferase family 2 protein [Notoacmeibacter ruber]|uniref:Glycosyltransferase n=1 Tax=Notoacmeibacter ruber TaxID=2670375 RepID=A0A3L7JDL4_9HYPH|nr:glycosyltransferase family 2 protein [Notoacmeibacter ruber]RLQ88857.1 glycosyltransferase [Notoacmeibacter ruber]